MTTFRTLDEIALAMLDFLRLVQPDLDTKPGSVIRDVVVDPTSSELSKLYNELRNVSNIQSLASAIGTDLDRLAKNFGQVRNTGTPSSGTVYFTTNDLTSDVFIPAGTLVNSQGGQSFATLVDISFDSSKSNVYRANASRIRSDLDLAGITDSYAVEVAVEATQAGTSGNVGKFAINRVGVPSISNVINVSALSGGTGSETDSAFRARVLGIFAGSNIGTTLGYVNTLLGDPRISDVLAVEPGDPLMTRDGTVTTVNDAGETIVVSSGTGGKVDLYIQGNSIETFSESFIYRDQSGKSDPTDPANDFVLGQRSINPLLDFQQKRRLLLGQGTLPFQPVDSIVSVSGSLSGPNFIEKYTDEDGIVRGSFELVKDNGAFGGSAFGFDKIRWISNHIALDDESASKGPFNGQDPLDFSGVITIDDITQEITVSNENSKVDPADRSILTLTHTPVVTTTRVDNLSTGERYTIANQNVDGGDENTSGRIQISGGTLPTSSDVLQVNYIWSLKFDGNIDYDNLESDVFTRDVQDSVDWGFANRVEAEEEPILYSAQDGYHVIVDHDISKVIGVNRWEEETVSNVSGKLEVSKVILNIRSVTSADGEELFYTLAGNGAFSGKEITLPTDTVLANGEDAIVIYNVENIYALDGYDTGSFSGQVVRVPEDIVEISDTVFVDYVANVSTLLPTTTVVSLPAQGDENGFIVSSSLVGNQPISNEFDVDGNITRNIRFSPSRLKMLVQGIASSGRLVIKGTSFTKIESTFVAQRDGLKLDLSQAIKNHFGISAIPSSMYVAYLASVEQVTVTDGSVSNVDFEFDTLNYAIKDAKYSNSTAIADSSLSKTEIKLVATENNTSQSPGTGDQLRVVFYVADPEAYENITVSSSGTKITKNKYAFVKSITVSSGFVNLSGSTEGTISIQALTQPTDGSTYFVDYSYTAPKEGERIVATYNFNRLVNDATFAIENVRPVTADVLPKAAGVVSIDVTIIVTPIPGFTQGEETLRQNVQETVTSFLTGGGLNSTIDASDIINAVYGVSGVDRVEITKFNLSGETGVARSFTSGRDKFFVAGIIDVSIEER